MRLNKYLADCGVASRRACDKLIEEGRVTVNGKVAQVGTIINPDNDHVTVNGKRVAIKHKLYYILLHKPKGYVTTVSDDLGRRTVMDLIDIKTRLYPVGRLDYDTEGALILTNDGELTNQLTHPKGKIEKKYHVWVNSYDKQQADKLESSIEIDGRPSIPAKVRLISLRDQSAMLEFTLYEGRNRQIRRLCEYAGMQVTRLKRVQEGHLCLGSLQVGKWRKLSEQEVRQLLEE